MTNYPKTIGLIDNLNDPTGFLESRFATASAADIMTATGGNTGNPAFVYGARKMIANPITRIGWGWTPSVVRERVSHIVISCANQIGKHADLKGWAERIAAFDLPVTLLGIGSQSADLKTPPDIPDGTRKFLELTQNLAANNAINIATRGEFTQGVLSDIGLHSLPLGCPSLHINGARDLGRRIYEKQQTNAIKRVAVSAGNPWDEKSAALEPLLVEIVEKYSGDYIIQHPESMIHFAIGERESVTTNTLKRFLQIYGPKFNESTLFEWYRRNAVFFVDVPNWIRYLKRVDFAIGPRYHGVALAIQSEVPGAVITIDGRTTELSQSSSIKSIDVADAATMTASDLLDAARWTKEDAEAFDQNRTQKAAGFFEFLIANELQPSPQLAKLAKRAD